MFCKIYITEWCANVDVYSQYLDHPMVHTEVINDDDYWVAMV